MRIAHRIHDLAVDRYGLSPSDLIFDALTFPLSTGGDGLRHDGIAAGRHRPDQGRAAGTFTTLGLSNISFGLNPAARQVLNSVFLHECLAIGLDSAIIHAGRILPLSKIDEDRKRATLDLIYDRRGTAGGDGTDPKYDPLATLLELFADATAIKAEVVDKTGWTVEQRLHQRIIDGDRDGLTGDLDEALETMKALEIVNDHLLGGMKVVGELFGNGDMQLPFVLQSAETMKAAVAYLEPHMERIEGEHSAKGRVVLATVKGDVHDIGKNLVDIILTNNGYEVHNLGIKISVTEMIDKALEIGADAIGMSGLLVKSTLIMRENLEELNRRGLSNIPVLLGGAALTRSYVERDLREVYDGRVFYGRDAFEGMHTLDKLAEMKASGIDDPDFGTVPAGLLLENFRTTKEAVDPSLLPARSPEVEADNEVFTPVPRLTNVKGLSVDEIATWVNETALFRHQWQFRPENGESDAEFKDRIRPLFRQQLADAKASGILNPAVVYGYFPANADGNDVIIWTDETRTVERARFSYPRQSEAPHKCIADFFRPVGHGGATTEGDYAAFHIVTMGRTVSDVAAELFAADKYQDYLFLHGLGVEMAEALAEMWHARIRAEWGFGDEDEDGLLGLFRQRFRGGRYSWGYPACPDLEDNALGLPICSRRAGSTSSATRTPPGSTSPSRRPAPSSATTPRPSTSSPADRTGGRGQDPGRVCSRVSVGANRSPRWWMRSRTSKAVNVSGAPSAPSVTSSQLIGVETVGSGRARSE
ncbi:MAG: vitamin B12 dependent-methionine synthase activation domain-containing protein [Acidimicrobiales bacterium]